MCTKHAPDGKERDVAKMKAKQIYDIIQYKEGVTFPRSSSKLKQEFELNEEALKAIYQLPIRVTTETKLREFQYRILNFLTNINVLLQKKNIKTTDLCDFCKHQEKRCIIYSINANMHRNFG